MLRNLSPFLFDLVFSACDFDVVTLSILCEFGPAFGLLISSVWWVGTSSCISDVALGVLVATSCWLPKPSLGDECGRSVRVV